MPETVFTDESKLIEAIRTRCSNSSDRPYLIAVDGRCASGKSTFAKHLADQLHASLFHMDDFFLPAEKRTAQRLSEPGGNIDYERFSEEILKPITENQSSVQLQRFDCHSMSLLPSETIPVREIVIIEGSYSMHPLLTDSYDLKIFLNCDPEVQLERLKKREEPDSFKRFLDRWIPLEEKYFSSFPVQLQSDLVLEQSAPNK